MSHSEVHGWPLKSFGGSERVRSNPIKQVAITDLSMYTIAKNHLVFNIINCKDERRMQGLCEATSVLNEFSLLAVKCFEEAGNCSRSHEKQSARLI